MKLAEVVPLFKSKDWSEKSNYRPISLLLTISKLLEKIVYKRVYTFLNNTNQLYCSQYGFRTGHFCVFLNLSKVFDMLEHTAIFQKLERYGIRGNALEWFKSYLSNCKIRVKINNTTSKEFPIYYGTPQGSCLGPLIFPNFL